MFLWMVGYGFTAGINAAEDLDKGQFNMSLLLCIIGWPFILGMKVNQDFVILMSVIKERKI